jgi:hypothetical protein
MRNVEMKVEGTTLKIEVDLTQDFGPSASGKTNSVASTLGNKKVPGFDDIFVGVNVYKK